MKRFILVLCVLPVFLVPRFVWGKESIVNNASNVGMAPSRPGCSPGVSVSMFENVGVVRQMVEILDQNGMKQSIVLNECRNLTDGEHVSKSDRLKVLKEKIDWDFSVCADNELQVGKLNRIELQIFWNELTGDLNQFWVWEWKENFDKKILMNENSKIYQCISDAIKNDIKNLSLNRRVLCSTNNYIIGFNRHAESGFEHSTSFTIDLMEDL
jgi:hypothetical protein